MPVWTWWNVIPATVGGLIAGSFALLGIWITGRREQRRTRDTRERETILAIRQALMSAADLYIRYVDPGDYGDLTDEGDRVLDQISRELTVHSASLYINGIRESIEEIARALIHTGIPAFHGDRERMVIYNVTKYGLDLTSSYLSGRHVPSRPAILDAYAAAMDEADQIASDLYEEERAEREAQRSRKPSASAEKPA
jgi:hypothetical protein